MKMGKENDLASRQYQGKRMDIKRLWHMFRLCTVKRGSYGRADYIREKKLFGAMGEKCTYMARKLPLYPKLIRFGNNVHCASGVTFIPHDRFYYLLNTLPEKGDYRFKEEIGCIEIGDNVVIGGFSIICNNVKIGNNVIVLAGSVVTKDIPDDSVVQGNPAKRICSVTQFAMARMSKGTYPDSMRSNRESIPPELEKWLWDSFENSRSNVNSSANNALKDSDNQEETDISYSYSEKEIYDQILAYGKSQFVGVDFEHEKNLVSNHIIDSLGIINLVTGLSDMFHISILYYDITAENLDNIHSMVRLVSRLTKDKSGEAASEEVSQGAEKEQVSSLEQENFEITESDFNYGSILEAVVAHAKTTPQKLCLADPDGAVTYSEYVRLIKKYAGFFKANSVNKGDCVVVEAIQSIDFLAIELAVQGIGGVFVPLENKCAATKYVDVSNACHAKIVVSVEAVENLPAGTNGFTYSMFKGSEIAETEITIPDENDVSEILFSTGTTGKEKGITLVHKNDIAVAENIIFGCKMRKDNVELIPSPLNHSHGLRSYYANMLNGAAVVIADTVSDMRKFFDMMDRYSVNSIDIVPSALTLVLKLSGNKLGEYKHKLRYMEFGSAAMQEADRVKIKELLPGVPLLNFYGSTESGRVSVYNFNTGVDKKGCIGKPTIKAHLFMVDSDKKEIVSSKECTGFLASEGTMNMIGYWEDPEETSAAMMDGVIFSKDEAYFDEDGDIILIGRSGDIINIGGKKVAPDEIETAALKMECIEDCGCVGIKDEITGMTPKLVVQMKAGCSFDKEAIINHLKNELEPFKVPKVIECIEKIPRTFNGKLIRRELK